MQPMQYFSTGVGHDTDIIAIVNLAFALIFLFTNTKPRTFLNLGEDEDVVAEEINKEWQKKMSHI
jgi:hypothetical protein